MAGKLTARSLESRAKRKGRYSDGDGLFLRVMDPGRKAYWVYRYTISGKEREKSIGSYPGMSLADARIKHADLRAAVLKGVDLIGDQRKASAAIAAKSGAATFGEVAEAYVERQERRGQLGKNPKHRRQWRATLASLPAWFRDLPVDQIGPQQVFDALDPIWTRTPETGSRLRGRMASVWDSARAPDDMCSNPAAWSDWLKRKLGNPKKLGKTDRLTGERIERGNHAAMSYANVPAFMTRLGEAPGGAARALAFTVLTCARTNETLGMTFDEVDFDKALWTVPASRMKTGELHEVPLSDAALAVLRAQYEARGQNPHVFPGRPMRPLSNMALAMVMRRMKVADATVHGFRSSFRTWASEVANVEFEVAEACLSHRVGSAVSRAYNRTKMTERRRPIMSAWAKFLSGEPSADVIGIKRGAA
jgi:integrase